MIAAEDYALLARLGADSLSATEMSRVSRVLGIETAAEVDDEQLVAELANQNRYLTKICNALLALQVKQGEQMAHRAIENQIGAARSPFLVDVLTGFAKGIRKDAGELALGVAPFD